MSAIILALLVAIVQAAPPQKIVGGSDTTITEYPYLVSVRYVGAHICGGVFITKQHVLTAAHCVQHEDSAKNQKKVPLSYLSIGSGSTSCIKVKNFHKVESYVVHPSYQGARGEYLYDIAVIKLAREIQESETQKILSLPSFYTSKSEFGYVVGWGKLSEERGGVSPTLKRAPMWTISNVECSAVLPKPVYSSQLCARYTPGLGFCDGDSGGPLIVKNQVVGIVSISYGCGTGKPDIYTRVQSYITWIKQQL